VVALVAPLQKAQSTVCIACSGTKEKEWWRVCSAKSKLEHMEPLRVRRIGLEADGAHVAPWWRPKQGAEVLEHGRAGILVRLGELTYLHPKVCTDVQIDVRALMVGEETLKTAVSLLCHNRGHQPAELR